MAKGLPVSKNVKSRILFGLMTSGFVLILHKKWALIASWFFLPGLEIAVGGVQKKVFQKLDLSEIVK